MNVREMLKEDKNLISIRDAEKIELTAINVVPSRDDLIAEHMGLDYFRDTNRRESLGPTVILPEVSRKDVSKLLLEESAYVWDAAKGCWPFYHVRAVFYRGSDSITVYFCFGCSVLFFEKDGEYLGGEDFDPIALKLLTIFRKALPRNEILESVASNNSLPIAK